MAGAKKKRGPAGGTAAPQNAEEGRRTPLASDVREARFESAALHIEGCECRKCRDAAIKRERLCMTTLSDLFEQATGHRVDFTEWGLDCLVRVLKNPNEVMALTRALQHHTSLTSDYGRGERKARIKLLGPCEKVEQVQQLARWKENLARAPRIGRAYRAQLQQYLADMERAEKEEAANECA